MNNNKQYSDTEILDFLERNLLSISSARATNSVYMDGTNFFGQLLNEARGSGGGPSYVKISHKTLRQGVIDAMNWKKE